MLTKEQKKELERRNAKIYKRFCNLSEKQPLAYPNTIYTELAKEFELSPQMISLIVRTAQQQQQQ
jgi:Mor family transcriptional regulator